VGSGNLSRLLDGAGDVKVEREAGEREKRMKKSERER
jgi:hypothetical protein